MIKKNLTVDIPEYIPNPHSEIPEYISNLYKLPVWILRILGYKQIPDEHLCKYEEQAKLARFATIYDGFSRYIKFLLYVYENNPDILDKVPEDMKVSFTNAVFQLAELLCEFLSETKLAPFMVQKEGGILLGIPEIFMKSEAKAKMPMILDKLNEFQIQHCWIHHFMPNEPFRADGYM